MPYPDLTHFSVHRLLDLAAQQAEDQRIGISKPVLYLP